MAQLPKVGWLHRCKECEAVTSRITTCKYKRTTTHMSVCLGCRPLLKQWFHNNFVHVTTEHESVGHQILRVAKRVNH